MFYESYVNTAGVPVISEFYTLDSITVTHTLTAKGANFILFVEQNQNFNFSQRTVFH